MRAARRAERTSRHASQMRVTCLVGGEDETLRRHGHWDIAEVRTGTTGREGVISAYSDLGKATDKRSRGIYAQDVRRQGCQIRVRLPREQKLEIHWCREQDSPRMIVKPQ